MNPGFDYQNSLAMDFDLNAYGYDEPKGLRFYDSLTSKISALPGVESATLADLAPLDIATSRTGVTIPGQEPPPGQSSIQISSNVVSSKYFQTLKIPILRGREFSQRRERDRVR